MDSSWIRVDSANDPESLVEAQRAFSKTEFAQRYKSRSFDLLRASLGDRILDVGCGPGVDLPALASLVGPSGFVVGVDRSFHMVRAAGPTAMLADAFSLPFSDETFDAVRADRVLQHFNDPLGSLAELMRITRVGGWIVTADPDQSTLRIELSDGAVSRGLEEFRRAAWPSGDIGHQMAALMREAGLMDVVSEQFLYETQDPHWAFGIKTWPQTLHDVGRLTDVEQERWEQVLAESVKRRLMTYSVTFFITAGRKPKRAIRV